MVLDASLPRRRRLRRAVERLAADRPPALSEVVVDVAHRGSPDSRADVVPAEAPAGRMVGGVVAVAGVVGDVEASDERDFAVDDHGLLVVAVERVLARVGFAADAGAAGQPLDGFANLLARGMEGGNRGARPHEHADVDAFGRGGEKLPDRVARVPAYELEVRRDVPAGQVDVLLGALDHRGNSDKNLCPFDQQGERLAGMGGGLAGAPRPVVGRIQSVAPAEATEAPSVLGAHRRLDTVTYEAVESGNQ